MYWNLLMHVLMGWLGPYFFFFTPEGIIKAVLIVCITQAVDQGRIKKEKWKEIESLPETEQAAATKILESEIRIILIKSFIQNVFLYTAVVLLAAELGRTHGWF
ncbi:hypothetical protein MNBD_GAMMA26-261 [hydrothermal vent metagenome]|uniref:Uncharacterized protein n=1 Tax=hydrothermal vent metagenome TaxID=652676 RepID=A0A3B1B592_9ZZZZ